MTIGIGRVTFARYSAKSGFAATRRGQSRSGLFGRGCSSPNRAAPAGELDFGVGLVTKVQPPGGVSVGAGVRRDGDEVRPIVEIEQAVHSRLAAPAPDGMKEQQPDSVVAWGPRPEPATADPAERPMDEPDRPEPGSGWDHSDRARR